MNYALSQTATMVKATPITIPTQPIGRIPRPVEPMERVKKGDSEDRKLAPLYDVAVRDTMARFAGAGSCRDRWRGEKASQFLPVLSAWPSEHGAGWLHDSVLVTVKRAAGHGSRAAPSVTVPETLGGRLTCN
jgi:hypothetical protein